MLDLTPVEPERTVDETLSAREIKPVAWIDNCDLGRNYDFWCTWQQQPFHSPLYTADALAAAREEGRQAGLVQAEETCMDQLDAHPMSHFDEGYNQAVRDCASAIRALKEK